jgi:hypothetical protein
VPPISADFDTVARPCVTALGTQLRMLKAQVLQFERAIGGMATIQWPASGSTKCPAGASAVATPPVAGVADPVVLAYAL